MTAKGLLWDNSRIFIMPKATPEGHNVWTRWFYNGNIPNTIQKLKYPFSELFVYRAGNGLLKDCFRICIGLSIILKQNLNDSMVGETLSRGFFIRNVNQGNCGACFLNTSFQNLNAWRLGCWIQIVLVLRLQWGYKQKLWLASWALCSEFKIVIWH